MRWTIVIILVALFAVVLVVGLVNMRGGMPVETATAKVSDISQYVDERGQTRLPQTHLITMPYAGRLEKIELEVGDDVSTADYVARVVPQDLKDELAEADAAVARLEAAAIEKGNLDLEEKAQAQTLLMVDAARERIKASRKRMDFAENFLAAIRELTVSGARTEEDVERAEVREVETKVEFAEDNLTLRIIEILPGIIEAYIGDQERGKVTLLKEKTEAEARQRQKQTKHDRGTMFSPVEGTVLAKHVENERHLSAGEVLLEIGQLDRLEVEADILSQDVLNVREGRPVEIYGPAIGAPLGEGVPGTVKQIYPAGFTKESSLGVEQQRVKVVIAFDEGVLGRLSAEQELGVGYRVRARIFTADSRGITVPRSALFRGPAGAWQLFAVRGGKARRVNVSVGLMNDQHVEILEGISENEQVILAPDTRLEDGVRVKPNDA